MTDSTDPARRCQGQGLSGHALASAVHVRADHRVKGVAPCDPMADAAGKRAGPALTPRHIRDVDLAHDDVSHGTTREKPPQQSPDSAGRMAEVAPADLYRFALPPVAGARSQSNPTVRAFARVAGMRREPVSGALPDCAIRGICRWWRQAAHAACLHCPQGIIGRPFAERATGRAARSEGYDPT